MGLAASQARFLGLTARKSNIEFQGQQINQARTALSNEVMGLYNKYSSVDVPVAPSKYDYTKTIYTVDSTEENYQITNFSKILEGKYEGYYNVTLDFNDPIYKGYPSTAKNAVISRSLGEDENISYLNFAIGTQDYTYIANDEENSTIKRIEKEQAGKFPGLQMLIDNGTLTGDVFYCYTNNNVTYFTSQDDLMNTEFSTVDSKGNPAYNGDYTFYYQGTQQHTGQINAVAALTQTKDGRLSTINVIECEDDIDLVGNSYSISVAQQDDEDGYADAMNQYQYEKDKYEKKLESLNKEIEKLQTEDKALEMKLAQLDTEQSAIATEMDSVSKVIEDTIESVFKTFNS